MRKMMEEQQEMFNIAIELNTQLSMLNDGLMKAHSDYSRESIRPEATTTKIFK